MSCGDDHRAIMFPDDEVSALFLYDAADYAVQGCLDAQAIYSSLDPRACGATTRKGRHRARRTETNCRRHSGPKKHSRTVSRLKGLDDQGIASISGRPGADPLSGGRSPAPALLPIAAPILTSWHQREGHAVLPNHWPNGVGAVHEPDGKNRGFHLLASLSAVLCGSGHRTDREERIMPPYGVPVTSGAMR